MRALCGAALGECGGAPRGDAPLAAVGGAQAVAPPPPCRHGEARSQPRVAAAGGGAPRVPCSPRRVAAAGGGAGGGEATGYCARRERGRRLVRWALLPRELGRRARLQAIGTRAHKQQAGGAWSPLWRHAGGSAGARRGSCGPPHGSPSTAGCAREVAGVCPSRLRLARPCRPRRGRSNGHGAVVGAAFGLGWRPWGMGDARTKAASACLGRGAATAPRRTHPSRVCPCYVAAVRPVARLSRRRALGRRRQRGRHPYSRPPVGALSRRRSAATGASRRELVRTAAAATRRRRPAALASLAGGPRFHRERPHDGVRGGACGGSSARVAWPDSSLLTPRPLAQGCPQLALGSCLCPRFAAGGRRLRRDAHALLRWLARTR